MKLYKFKLLMLVLITSTLTFAQSELIYSKSFDTNSSTTAIFNLKNTTVTIEESMDKKIHFDYKIEFINYSKKSMDSILKEYTVEATMFENNIALKAVNKNMSGSGSYAFDDPYNDVLMYYFAELMVKKEGTEMIVNELNKIRKSKALIIEEINLKSGYKNIDEIIKFYKSIDKNGKHKDISQKNIKAILTSFVIKLPPYVKLNINGNDANITFKNEVKNELLLDLDRGFFKATSLTNTHNKVKINYLKRFTIEEIIGGDYTLKNVVTCKIGTLKEVKIISELSKIEIGEIQKNVTITDFNSEYWFYNWSDKFSRFDLFAEYSKIHYFYPESDYSLKVVGNNTVNYLGKTKITMQPTKNGEKFKMMERKRRRDGVFAGSINFDIVNGVIFSYDDSFIKNKN